MNANYAKIPALLTAITASLAAQSPTTFLFSPLKPAESLSGSGGTVLGQLNPASVDQVTPAPGGGYSAEAFIKGMSWQTMVGDEDGDGDVHSPFVFRGVDAVLVKPYRIDRQGSVQPRNTPVTPLDTFISPVADLGTNVSGAPGLRRGDCGAVVRNSAGNGQIEHFITADQIVDAFGIIDRQTRQRLDPKELNLDAICVDGRRNIFLSFEETQILTLIVSGAPATIAVADGAVLWLPPAAWTYDARGNVASVVARRGRVALSEFDVDALVTAAGIADFAGGCPVTIGDTDALAIDRRGGSFTVNWGGTAYSAPHLLIGGETLTNAGVIATAGGGTIGAANGVPLAAACGAGTTSGPRMGLSPLQVTSLDGLDSLARAPGRFVMGSPTPTGLGGAIEVHIGTNQPVAGVWLFFGLGTLPVSASIDFTAIAPGTSCFPELYPAVLAGGPIFVPTAADGFGNQVGVFGPVPSPVLPTGLLMQAAAWTGSVQLSTPITLH